MLQTYTSIQSGFNVSAEIDLRKHRLVGIQVPVVNSGDLAFRVSFDPTSANFMRLATLSGDLTFATAAGSRSVTAPHQLSPWAYARLETVMPVGSAQTDTRTFGLLLSPRHLK